MLVSTPSASNSDTMSFWFESWPNFVSMALVKPSRRHAVKVFAALPPPMTDRDCVRTLSSGCKRRIWCYKIGLVVGVKHQKLVCVWWFQQCVCVCIYIYIYIYIYNYMYVCMYTCMYVCIHVCMYVCIYVCICVCTWVFNIFEKLECDAFVNMCVCVCVCVCVWYYTVTKIHACACVNTYEYLHVHKHAVIRFVCALTHRYRSVCIYMCVCVYICVCVCMYICAYIHTYT